jgi:hypothetical protein
MSTQEQIALISAVIAATSVTANLLMGILLYKLNRRNLKRDEVLAVMKSLLHRLDATRLFEMDPEQEIWEFGFETLRELAVLCAPANVVTQTSRFVPSEVRKVVPQLSNHVKGLRAFQDSWKVFRSDKAGDWRSIQQEWPEIKEATAALQTAQPVAAECKRALLSLVGQL